jgi:hypothetical protein
LLSIKYIYISSGVSKGDSDVADKGNRKRYGVPSKRTLEKKLIDEIMTLSGIMEETPGRAIVDDCVEGAATADNQPHT